MVLIWRVSKAPVDWRTPPNPISFKTVLKTQFFPTSGVPHFYQNRLGNFIFSEIRCAQFPSQQIWRFNFSRHMVCPISIQADLEITFFPTSGVFHCHQNSFGSSLFLQCSTSERVIRWICWRNGASSDFSKKQISEIVGVDTSGFKEKVNLEISSGRNWACPDMTNFHHNWF